MGLQLGGQQLGLDVVQVRGADDDVGGERVDALRPSWRTSTPVTCGAGARDRRAGQDRGHRRAGVQPRPVLLGEARDRLDQPGEAALGVEDAGRRGRACSSGGRGSGRGRATSRGTPRDSRAPAAAGESANRATPRGSPATASAAARARGSGAPRRVRRKARGGVEAGVEEAAQGEVVGVAGRVEVGIERGTGTRLDRTRTARGCSVSSRPHVDGLVVALEEHAVARGRARSGRPRLGGRGAEQLEEVVEDLRHEPPRGTGVEAETRRARTLPTRPPRSSFFSTRSTLVTVAREEGGGGEAGDAAADDDDLSRCARRGALDLPSRSNSEGQPGPRAGADAAMRIFSGVGTRTRYDRIWAGDVARRRRVRSANKSRGPLHTARGCRRAVRE